jgi:hypothetical protein
MTLSRSNSAAQHACAMPEPRLRRRLLPPFFRVAIVARASFFFRANSNPKKV